MVRDPMASKVRLGNFSKIGENLENKVERKGLLLLQVGKTLYIYICIIIYIFLHSICLKQIDAEFRPLYF